MKQSGNVNSTSNDDFMQHTYSVPIFQEKVDEWSRFGTIFLPPATSSLIIICSAWQSLPLFCRTSMITRGIMTCSTINPRFQTSNSVTRASLCREYERLIAIAKLARSIQQNSNYKTVTLSLFFSRLLFPILSFSTLTLAVIN